MAFVSVTRLRLRSPWFLPGFLLHTVKSSRQAGASAGLAGGYVATGAKLTFWTVTVWETEDAMRAFRAGGAHVKAMPKLANWCDQAAVAHWVQDAAAVPPIPEATRRLGAEGRLSKVRHPSPEHARGELWPDGLEPRMGFRVGG